uniref:Uncharacterized protein n=1 Tax=Anopheles maculatus TaxID=74869 RepID=A0A182SWY6_9DIPT
MKGSGILQILLVVVLSATSYFPHCVEAQFALGSPHVISLEDYDSDEVIPLVRRLRIPETNNFKRNYRSHPSGMNPRVLTPAEPLPISDDLMKQLQSLLSMNPKKKAPKQKHQRSTVAKPAEKYTSSVTTPTTPTTSTVSTMSTMSTTTKRATDTSQNSREIGKKWFPVLLKQAIDNVLRKKGTEHDELDELVDQIAAGSGVYARASSPMVERYETSTVRNSFDRLSTVESDMVRVNLSTASGSVQPTFTQWHNMDQLGSGVPCVVNIFNNTKIGYIVMKVSNDSEIRVESPENAYENVTVDGDIERIARKILTEINDEHGEQRKQSTTRSQPNGKLKLPYLLKTTPTMPMAGGSQTMEPPFFNILKTPDNEPLKYRVLLRNSDSLPEKVNVRLPLPGPLPKSQHPVKVLTGDRRSNHANGRQPTPKRKPMFYSEEKPTILRNRHPLKELIEVPSVEFEPDSRPVRRHGMGRVVRKYDYESLEEELPFEESDITYPDTNTVTQRTAKILASGKHNSPAKDSNEKRHRTTPEPFTESQRYNFRRTFGPTASGVDSDELRTTTPSSWVRDTYDKADLPGDDVLFNQASAKVFVKAKANDGKTSYRRQDADSDGSDEPLKMSFDTSGNDLFERSGSRSKRILKKSRWESENSSEEGEDSSSS